MRVAYITDEVYLRHNPGPMHPESKHRLVSINNAVDDIRDELIEVEPISVAESIIELVHPPEHIEMIKDFSASERAIDGDTICSVDSFLAAKNCRK